MEIAKSTKQSRFEIYSCAFCAFVEEDGIENLKPIEELKYIFHLKQSHGIER